MSPILEAAFAADNRDIARGARRIERF